MMRLALAAAVFAALTVANTGPSGYPLYGPDNIAVDRSGNLFVTDHAGANKLRLLKLAPDGKIAAEWHIFAPDGPQSSGPEDVTLDAAGFVYVTDRGARDVVKLSPTGDVVARFGEFHDLGHIVLDSHGDMLVCEGAANRITRLSPDGRLLDRRQRTKGIGLDQSYLPESMAIDRRDNLYVLDFGNRRVLKIAPSGKTLGAFPLSAREPAGLALDSREDMYVPDQATHLIFVLAPDGTTLRSIEYDGSTELFRNGPGGVAIDTGGNLYAPDGAAIVKLTLTGKLLARFE